MMSNHVHYPIFKVIIIMAVIIISAFTIYHLKTTVVTLFFYKDSSEIMYTLSWKVNTWHLNLQHLVTCGRGFCQTSEAMYSWDVLFQAICKYCVVWHTASTWRAWPLELIWRAFYSCGKPVPWPKGKVCFEGALQLKGECVAPLRLPLPLWSWLRAWTW